MPQELATTITMSPNQDHALPDQELKELLPPYPPKGEALSTAQRADTPVIDPPFQPVQEQIDRLAERVFALSNRIDAITHVLDAIRHAQQKPFDQY